MGTVIKEFQGDHNFLSNFYPSQITYKNRIFPNVETAYQAAKATNIDDFLYVANAASPGAAKKRGQKIACRSDWENVKVEIMYLLLLKKFQQEKFMELLKQTGDARLEEGNRWGDKFWGVSPPGSGVGQNMLGELLMRIRKLL